MESKEIVILVLEIMLMESESDSWWVDSATIKHIFRNKVLLVKPKEKQTGELRVYMNNNTYCNVLGKVHANFM